MNKQKIEIECFDLKNVEAKNPTLDAQLNIWVPSDKRAKFDKLMQLTNRKFVSGLRSVIIKYIDATEIDPAK